MSTHFAVATVGVKAKLELIRVPTVKPTGDQVRIRNEWTASTPLDLHQNDGGLLVKHPQVLGDGTAGTVVEVGPDVKRLKVGDKVFGFTWRTQAEKGQQEFATVEEWLLAKLPEDFTLAEAITLPDNLVTVFHTLTADLGIELPWPKPNEYVPANADSPILIWGGSSSVGQFALQVLRYYGYTNVLATASRKQHDKLRNLGAKALFDYNDQNIVASLLQEGGATGIPLIFDCIGSKYGSIAPISQVARDGAKVAILLPVIVRDSTEVEAPEYEMDVKKAADWKAGVDARGVRTHFYLDNEFFRYHLQPDIMPTMLKERIVEPQRQKIVEGATLLERAQKAMDMLRRKEVSMERLVWSVSDTEP
ncbi:GroES-like protein [Macroventuria anomochaeta]|uniref:GroES-like protein n=1 Tax=Macroventuria anomochaeta TaxID=301207 RepID=A0ACB6RYF9_9PLEO|nr:GroES-like protein [Macroventuria anomochaeta]KAF2626758.1 GroES-like protein [Macroventuria anomochaeta]